MWKITKIYLMQVVKHVFVKILVQCKLRVYVVLLRKLEFLCSQPSFNLRLRWILWPKHSLLYFHPSCFSSPDPFHSISCNSNQQQNHLLVTWADPGSDLNRFLTKPSKLSALLVNQKATLRIECTTQSHLR
jgi:hypothetical protein